MLFENEEIKSFKFEYNETINKFNKIETLESKKYLILKNNEWVKEELNNSYSLSDNNKNLTFEDKTFKILEEKKLKNHLNLPDKYRDINFSDEAKQYKTAYIQNEKYKLYKLIDGNNSNNSDYLSLLDYMKQNDNFKKDR